MIPRSKEYLEGLVRELCSLTTEAEWVEFKQNNADPERIGEYVSALANSAALVGKQHGYLVWGVTDDTHQIAGTVFDPSRAKKGNEPLETWLLRLLEPKISFRFYTVEMESYRVVVLEIDRATGRPVLFKNIGFVRVGDVTKKLKDVPERERELWRTLDKTAFEELVAADNQSADEILRLIDYPAYFELLDQRLPENRQAILDALSGDQIIRVNESGRWDITNLGSVLLSKRMAEFRSTARKAIRVVQYRGTSRMETIREHEEPGGYAVSFRALIEKVCGWIPTNEIVESALRKSVPMFPELAIRELIANALIHQDFEVSGAGPLVEIFADRIEITNPGEPLVSTDRIVDSPPRSRNEMLASLMRRFGICEERGSGIDKVLGQIELFQLPAPLFEAPEGFTRVTMFAHKEFKEMDRRDKVRACYLHACLRYVTRQKMTNTTLRERFGIQKQNTAEASRLLRDALEAGVIVIEDPNVGTRSRSYLPFWAAPGLRRGIG